MTSKHPTLCVSCTHLRERATGKPFTCDAFPGGIPQAIVMFGGDHRTTRRGDHGVTYEQREGAEAKALLDDWLHVEGGGSGGN